MVSELQTAYWEHSKKKAKLISNDAILIDMEFKKKAAIVKIGNEKFEIRTDGFWCPIITISKKDTAIVTQKQIGLWGSKSEFVLNNQTFTVMTRQGTLFNISYTTNGADVLIYKLDVSKNKPKITFEVKSNPLDKPDMMLLLALGFFSIRNVAIEVLSDNFMVSATVFQS